MRDEEIEPHQQLVVNDSTQRAAAIDGLEYISQLVCRYAQIEHIYLQGEEFELRKNLEAAILKLYTQTLEYEVRAARQFNRKSSHQTMRNVVQADSWDSILDTVKASEEECDKLRTIIDSKGQENRMTQLKIMLSQQSDEVNKLLETSRARDEAFLAEMKAMREDQKASFQKQKQADCHQCFRVADYETTMNINPERVPKTCEWFLGHPRYIGWLNDQGPNLLWVTADPGCGKSVLSKFLVHNYRSWMRKDISICYFFFKDNSEKNRSATHALSSILHQLFRQNPALLKHAIPEFDSEGNELCRLFGSLWSILLSAAADFDSGGIVCILDALDECSESSCEQLVKRLANFQSTDGKVKIKFLITSRSIEPVWRIFSQTFSRHDRDLASVRLMGENDEEMKEISAEIKLLIDAKVQEFKKLRSNCGIDDNAAVALKAKLDGIENRTYLWIALIFPELIRRVRYTEEELLETIERIPSTVDEAYEKILSKSSDPDQARRLLHIVCAASRPFTLLEMNRALSIRDKDHMMALKAPESFRVFIRDLCGLFISIKNSRIYLIHQTAKEFLIRKSAPEERSGPTTPHDGRWKNSLEPADSHHLLAHICMSYFFSFESWPEKWWEDNFLPYSAREWPTHFQRAGGKEKEMTLSSQALEICNPQSPQFDIWFPAYAEYPMHSNDLRSLTSLHVGSYVTGLEEVVRLLLRDDVKCNIKDDLGYTPLAWATETRNCQVMKLLLGRDDVDPNSRDNDDRTPLHWAIFHKEIQAVKLLLTQGNVDPDAKDCSGQTPLSWAAEEGSIDGMKLLLDRDVVDPDSKDINNRTPFSYAAGSNCIDGIKLLLARGDVDLESKDVNHRTPLSYAAQRGSFDAMEFLLAQGVDCDCKDIKNRTPLSWAAEKGSLKVMKLLLAQGAEVDSKDIQNRTPLSYAVCSRYNNDTVTLLLARNDVDPDSKDINNRSPLSYAVCQEWNHKTVTLLLARDDVDPDSTDINNRSPLSYAAGELGNDDIVKLLLNSDVEADSKDIHNRTPLSYAAGKWKNDGVVKLLLNSDVEADSMDINNRTPLSYAVCSNHNIDTVKLLLGRDDVDPDSVDNDGHTPTWHAIKEGEDEYVTLMRARKATIASRKERGAGSVDT